MNMSPTNSRQLLEFTWNRAACGPGGEQLWLRWNEDTFDSFFTVGEFEWHLQKQCDSQAMLIFPDKNLSYLCPYLALVVIALYDGLARAGMPEHKWDYVFPGCIKMRQAI